MVHATNFLLRWLYLNNLIYERAEIQSLPYIHPNYQERESLHQHGMQHFYHDRDQQTYDETVQHHGQQLQRNSQLYEQSRPASHNLQNAPISQPRQMEQNYRNRRPWIPKHVDSEIEWKRRALHSITLYPPGSLRLLVLDSLRLEIVHELARELHNADKILHEHSALRRMGDPHCSSNEVGRSSDSGYSQQNGGTDLQSFHDFQKAAPINFEEESQDDISGTDEEANSLLQGESQHKKQIDQNTVSATQTSPPGSTLSRNESHSEGDASSTSDEEQPSTNLEPKVLAAVALQREIREYLPQLVSALLHSPAPLTRSTMFTSHLNPLGTLRRLLMTRCVRDPNLGIELCWLLEAEVGRAWKSLFEHRQQTGRRLILVLPADRAAVIQKIGSEKRAAFDLLQDAESATAYGVYGESIHNFNSVVGTQDIRMHQNEEHFPHDKDAVDAMGLYATAQLPESLSLQRCSHFGDTMHFIDLLTKISLDLILCPVNQRNVHLAERLEELNRRLRRRMITKGNVSLDVEDNRGPYDWPTLGDISSDSMKYSIHFPLEPTATVWPGSHEDTSASQTHARSPLLELKTEHGVMRVLNIVSSKCRVLASRERCPYLVHCEVLETGLEGRDARLYASRSGTFDNPPMQETFGVVNRHDDSYGNHDEDFKSFGTIPDLDSINSIHEAPILAPSSIRESMDYEQFRASSNGGFLPRGGGQEGGFEHSTIDASGYLRSPYDLVREEQLQQLHEHFQANQQHPHYGPSPQSHQMHFPQSK